MKGFKTYLLFIVIFSALAFILTGCGGGGGDGGPAPTPTPTPTTSSVTISGLVGGGGGGAGGGSVAKAQTLAENPLANAIVEISAYDKNNALTGSVTTSTLSTGTFNAPIILSANGGYIVINITKGGFAGYSKRIDFEKPSDVNIQAILDAAVTAIVPVSGDSITISSTGKKVVKIALFKDKRTGKQTIVKGSAIALRKQQGNGPVLEIAIPVAPLTDAGISTLKADLASFNPVTDSESFPGEFADNYGNQLVSTGFDYINITDDLGQNLGSLMAVARAQGRLKKAPQEEPTYITRQIPPGVCKNLLRDAACEEEDDKGRCKKVKEDDKDAGEGDGYQVPVYTYNPRKGEWVLLGFGQLDVNGDGLWNDDDPQAVGDLNDDDKTDHKDYQIYCKQREDEGNYLTLIIEITNEDFLADWWNLDYPLIFEEPKELCIIKTFKDDAGNPIEGLWTYLYDDVDYTTDSTWSFSNAWGSTDSDGKVTLKTVLTDSTDTDREAKIGFYNPFDWSWLEESVTLGESPNCTELTNTITKPEMCQVEGSVKDEGGSGVANQYVYAYGVSTYDYRYAYTDNNGYFLMDVKCNTDYDLYTGWNWEVSRVFNVNGATIDYPGSENKDEADKVTLKDIILQNQAPYAYGWLSSTSIFAGSSITAYIYGWDNECDTPMNWSISGAPSNITGTTSDCWFYREESITFSSDETYPLSLSVKDSKGKTGSADLGTVEVSQPAKNRPPVISNAYPSKYSAGKETPITLYGSAYDLDGDSLTYNWTDNGTGTFGSGCSGSGGSSISATCPYTTPNQNGSVTIKFEVFDGVDTVSQDFNISVGSTGGVDIIIQKKRK